MSTTEPINTSERIILAKIEATTGVDANPTEPLNAILVESLEVTKMQTKTIDRKPVQSFMGAGSKIIASFDSTIKVKVALTPGANASGLPVVGTLPHYDALLRICGMQPTITASAVTGTAQGGTLQSITLAASGPSATDDFYSGLRLTTTLSGVAQAGTIQSITLAASGTSTVDDFYKDSIATIQYFPTSTTIVSTGDTLSNKNKIYLPVGIVGSNNLKGAYITLTTSGITETRKIMDYNATNQLAKLNKQLATVPTSTTTFKITEKVKILSYVGSTKIATLQRNLKFTAAASTPYSIQEFRTITDYNGTNKVASVTPPFLTVPSATSTYAIGANVTYSLLSKNIPTATFYYYEGDYLYAFTYARGDLSISADSGNLLFADITCTGILDRYEDAVIPASTAGNFADPLPINFDNINALSLHGYENIVLKKMSIGLNNAVKHDDNPGANRIRLSARDVKGSLTIDAVRPGDFDFIDTIKNGYSKEFLFSLGPVGNNVTLICPNTQLGSPKDSDSDGALENSMDMNMPAKAPGNNEIKIILQ